MKFIASVITITISVSCIIATSNVHAVNANLVHNVLRENLIRDSTNKASKFNLRSGSRQLDASASESESESLSESEDSPSSDDARRKLDATSSESDSSDDARRKLDASASESDSESLSESEDSPSSDDASRKLDAALDRTGLVQMNLRVYQSGATIMSGNGLASTFLGIMMVGFAHLI
eukprot:CAMPEP_0197283162 /NCGR_PEP_ID=MMETSP1432-20130617/24778_1 /TAXON_ID=44447 /ORGANISM="Pseudo-nitzschia delicatissima, Strain UNC1205" /LENGTH=177 /DNA_ID=CAMNT_0042750147 /DNA_START=72 /DNA_END=605 /DNA_ORIENTATION=+